MSYQPEPGDRVTIRDNPRIGPGTVREVRPAALFLFLVERDADRVRASYLAQELQPATGGSP